MQGDGTMDTERAVAAQAVVPVEEDVRGALSLAREMAEAYQGYVKFYHERMEKTTAEAHLLAVEPADDEWLKHVQESAADQVSWHALSTVAERDPDLARRAWGRIVQEARDDLASGNRAARAMEGYNHDPWDRAKFLALRESLSVEWQPRNGIEWMLVEMLAQAYSLYEREVHLVMTYTMMEASLNDHYIAKQNKYEPPRLTSVEALARAEQAMERYQRMILRVQRALRDQRRFTLNVGSVGQLNIGLVQQNVVSDSERERNESPMIEGRAGESAS